MDGDRFDALAKAFAHDRSRRSVLKGLGAVALGALGLARLGGEAEASSKKRSVGNSCAVNADCASNLCVAEGRARKICHCGGVGDCPPASDQCHQASCTAGGCSVVPTSVGSPCGTGPRCLNGAAIAHDRCDGNGTCGSGVATPCAPYICRGSTCLTTCAAATDCTTGNYCASGHCVPKGNLGTACTAADQCLSGHCVDGVCCDGICAGQCEACNSSGVCAPVTGAPHGSRAACGTDSSVCSGACDGVTRTACAYPAASTVCRSASCVDGTETFAAACDGAGHCPAALTQSCGSYVCGATVCETSCATDADCIDAAFCDTSVTPGVCRQDLPLGDPCSRNHQCVSGHCVDGVCCDGACADQCAACNLQGSAGQCLPVPAGAPHGGRRLCNGEPDPNSGGASICGGSCDGASATCAYPSSSTTCQAPSCAGGVFLSAAMCDGLGNCNAPGETICAPYVCNAARTACLTSCGTDADCASGDHCSGGACVVGCLPAQAACLDQAQCCQTLATDCATVSSLSGNRCCRPATVLCSAAADCCGDAVCGVTDTGPTYCCYPEGHACVPSEGAPTGCCLGAFCVNNACCTPQAKATVCAGRCGFLIESACGLSYDCGACVSGDVCTADQQCCTPHSQAVTCNGVCGDVVDNCGQTVSCTCGALKNCVSGRCHDCTPLGGICGYPDYDAGCCQADPTICRSNTSSGNANVCCHALHGSCSGDYQCCESLICQNGGCCFPTNYQNCHADSDCCSGSCNGGGYCN